MNVRIPVSSRREAEQLREGLADPEVRAFVRVVATLQRLPSQRARERVLRFFYDQLDEAVTNATVKPD